MKNEIYNILSSLVLSGVRVTRFLVLCLYFIDRCLFFCPFSFWSLCCPFFFDLRILINPLVYSNSDYHCGFLTLFLHIIPSYYHHRCLVHIEINLLLQIHQIPSIFPHLFDLYFKVIRERRCALSVRSLFVFLILKLMLTNWGITMILSVFNNYTSSLRKM